MTGERLPVIGLGTAGARPVVVPNTARDDRYLAERDFTNACMRGKGYALTPSRQ